MLQHKGVEQGGMVVEFTNGKRTFANLGEAVKFCNDNFGIINNPDGSRLCGRSIDEMKEDGSLK